MNKKGLVLSVIIIMITMLSVSISSCSKEEKESSNSIVGTWTGQDGSTKVTFVFKTGGTGTYVLKDDYYGDAETGNFSYTMTGDNKGFITITINSSYTSYSGSQTFMLYFSLEGGKTLLLCEDRDLNDVVFILSNQ